MTEFSVNASDEGYYDGTTHYASGYAVGFGYTYLSYFVFNVSGIPKNAVINSAHLDIISYTTKFAVPVNLKIHACIDGGVSLWPSNRPAFDSVIVSGGSDWDINETWEQDVTYSTPDIKTEIQSAVNAIDFTSARPMLIKIVDDGSAISAAYRWTYADFVSTSLKVKLFIDWNEPAVDRPPDKVQNITMYRCILTGAEDGTTDVELDMGQFSGTIKSGAPSTFSATVPYYHGADLADRPNGTFIIYHIYQIVNDVEIYEELYRATLKTVFQSLGPENRPWQITGEKQETYASGTAVTLTHIGTKAANQTDGKWTLSAKKLIPGLRPGTQVIFDDADFILGAIQINANGDSGQTVYFKE